MAMLTIRAARCVYRITREEYIKYFRPREHRVTAGARHVTYETRDTSFELDEHYFNLHVLPRVPMEVAFNALKRGKPFSRYEKSLATKGSGKHRTYTSR